MKATPCPKCHGKMTPGFVPDFSYAAVMVGHWHPGVPQRSFWTNTKVPATGGLPIGAFRCEQCGYLEFYAAPEFAAQ